MACFNKAHGHSHESSERTPAIQLIFARLRLTNRSMPPQIPLRPSMPPGFVPPPMDMFGFLMFYLVVLELVLLALPRKIEKRILETLFPILRRPLPKK